MAGMNREEAIKQLKQIIDVSSRMDCNEKEIDAFDEEALEIAIQALEQNYDEEWRKKHYENSYNLGFLDGVKAVEKRDKQEPREDCISRTEVLKMQYRIDDSASLASRDVVNVDDINDLPPVTPQPNTGHWIPTVVRGEDSYICSECGAECCYIPTTFCPECGSYNGGEE